MLVVADDNLALLGQIGSVVKVNGVLGEHRVIAKFRRINYMAKFRRINYMAQSLSRNNLTVWGSIH